MGLGGRRSPNQAHSRLTTRPTHPGPGSYLGRLWLPHTGCQLCPCLHERWPRIILLCPNAHFSHWFTDPATGRPTWRVALDLLYGQVIKAYRRRELTKVERRMQHGQPEDLQQALQRLGFTGSLNTAFVERLNLTLRHSLAALTRRSWATAQLTPNLEAHLEWWRVWYHFCCPHQELRQKLDTPLARKGQQAARLYRERTPAMAAGLVNHIWSVEELLLFPVG